MSNYPPEAWRRLGGLLRSRRAHIDPSYRNRGAFCEATGLNYKLVQEVESASRTSFTDESLALLEQSYRLVEGAIRHTLAGGPLETLPAGGADQPAVPSSPEPPELPSVDLDSYVGQTPMERALLYVLRSNERAREVAEERLQQQLRELNDKVDRLSGQRHERDNQGHSGEAQLGA